ncbi:MAG: BON domain-containing protein [Ramlibacter sp.]|nr:BON domain-containing protein [Ramlibacter sp.]MBX3657308.1 BON domain-containing protein [Ramlibacter sp.]MCW5649260.1 BON domain-containing protein [Ramlibacter sp.]
MKKGNTMNTNYRKPLLAASAMAVLLALGACGKKVDDDATVGQKLDSSMNRTEQVAKDTTNDAKQAMESTGSALKDAAQDAQAAVKQTGEKIAEKLDDATITAEVNAGLAKDASLSAIKINVDTRDGKVTLKGPAPTSHARDRATEIAKAVKGVQSVDNQLTVQAS